MKFSLFTIALVYLLLNAAYCGTNAADNAGKAWVDWDRGVIVSSAQAKMSGVGGRDALVERATSQAKLAAEEQLVLLIGGQAASDTATRAALIRVVDNCCTMKSDAAQRGTSVTVTVEVPVSRATGILGSRTGAGPAQVQTVQTKPTQVGPFTSVIVDTLGLRVDRAMSPKIRRADGSEVWGTVKVDLDYVADHGIVAYARSTEEARTNERAGANPLVVRAIGRSGGKFYCDAVIGEADAKLLLDENAKSKFLDGFKVIFVVDGEL